MCDTYRSGAVAIGLSLICMSATQFASGQTLVNPVAEPKKQYELRIIRVGDTFRGIRFMPGSGETWKMAGDKWEALPESEKLPAGNYDVTLIATGDKFIALRLNRNTGATWLLKDGAGAWSKIKEPQPTESQPRRSDGKNVEKHELRHVQIGTTAFVIRFNVKTGESSIIESNAFKVLPESGAVPEGNYDVTMIATEIKGRWMAFRVDRSSGSTWQLRDRKWFKVSDPN